MENRHRKRRGHTQFGCVKVSGGRLRCSTDVFLDCRCCCPSSTLTETNHCRKLQVVKYVFKLHLYCATKPDQCFATNQPGVRCCRTVFNRPSNKG
eukprot:TRINITY_DN109625_c0_g1_i1.p1 TRINITY_DN109625_c0_g1~~TRINITY_DN109625_c0_g1_i1.p1  ORF type:complete len:109 (+),score=2.28 TRINITY_DN109625_c0_g1_i1:45-329(+)